MSIKIVTLDKSFEFIRNGASIKQGELGGLPITRIETISDQVINPDKLGYAGLSEVGKYEKWILQQGDILLTHINSPAQIGKCAMYDEVPKILIHGMNLLCFRPLKSTEPKYLLYALRSSFFRRQLPNITNKSVNQASISVTNIKSLKIPLPPLDEQKRIAAILDQADELRQKRQQAITECDNLLKSTFLQMFGDPVTNPKGLPTKKLKDFGQVITGNTPPRKNMENYGDDCEWIKSDNINTPNMYLTTARESLSIEGKKIGRTAPVGSLLVTCIAGSKICIGNVAIADREVCFNQQINALVPHAEQNYLFLYSHFLFGKRLIQNASTDGMKGLVSKSKFSEVRFLMPPMELQNKFAEIVKEVESSKTKMQQQLKELNDNFNALTQKAFKGEL